MNMIRILIFYLWLIIHELMHLFFETYYWDICNKKGLNDDQISNIKESFSVLINFEFIDILKSKDSGYKEHKKIRQFISKEWIKSKIFKKVLLATCDYVKEYEN